MRKAEIFILVLSFFLVAGIINSCKKKTKSEALNFDRFYGITETDEDGNIISEDGDWCLRGQFLTTLFGPAYPNPATDSCEIFTQLFSQVNIRIEVYNSNRTLVRSLVSGQAPGQDFITTWDLNDNAGNRVQNGLYRAFLILDEFRCHGDIMVRSPE